MPGYGIVRVVEGIVGRLHFSASSPIRCPIHFLGERTSRVVFRTRPTLFQGPIKQRMFKTDVAASFLALDPFVTEDLLAFG
jgi:hypothetical protein